MNFKVIGTREVFWDLLPTGRQLGGATAILDRFIVSLAFDNHLQ